MVAATRNRNANVHPGDAIPKRTRRTKEQLEAAQNKKLTNVARAEDQIVRQQVALEASEPRQRPPPRRTLKRTASFIDVRDANEENEVISDGEQTKSYTPEGSIDPASDSDAQPTGPPAKKRKGKQQQPSFCAQVQLIRQGLSAIEEAGEDGGDGDGSNERMVVDETATPAVPFKTGLRKNWESQNGCKNPIDEPITPAAKPSKKGTKTQKAVAPKAPRLEPINPPKPPKRTKENSKGTTKGKEKAVAQLEGSDDNMAYQAPPSPIAPALTGAEAPVPTQPRPRPRKLPLGSQPNFETPITSTHPRAAVAQTPITPVNFGGIPEDESDSEEYRAAKSSPVKGGKRITSNAIVAVRPVVAEEKAPRPVQALPAASKPAVTHAEKEGPHGLPPVSMFFHDLDAQDENIAQSDLDSDSEVEVIGGVKPNKQHNHHERAALLLHAPRLNAPRPKATVSVPSEIVIESLPDNEDDSRDVRAKPESTRASAQPLDGAISRHTGSRASSVAPGSKKGTNSQ